MKEDKRAEVAVESLLLLDIHSNDSSRVQQKLTYSVSNMNRALEKTNDERKVERTFPKYIHINLGTNASSISDSFSIYQEESEWMVLKAKTVHEGLVQR